MTPIAISDALNEVLGSMNPYPLSIELSVVTGYANIGATHLKSNDEFTSFVYRVAAAMHTGPTSESRRMMVGMSLSIFCKRRGIVVEGFGAE